MVFGECTWPQIPEQKRKVVVLPIGSMEQHGRHLPLLTDTLICSEIVRRAEVELGDEALFLPTLWVGLSEHHRGFTGTLSLGHDTYVRFLTEILDDLISDGFSRIALFNAHGGNRTPAETALYDLQMRHRDRRDLLLGLITWYEVAASEIEKLPRLVQKRVTHACELETSMMLRLRPDLVHLDMVQAVDLAARPADEGATASYVAQIATVHPFDHTTASGGTGHPEDATAAKGELLFVTATASLVRCIRDMAGWQPPEPK